MKKIALFSVIALSALMVGCSSTQTRNDSSAQTAMASTDGSAKVCPKSHDGKMCAKCAADKKMAMACKDCKNDGTKCAKCAAKDQAAMACPLSKDGKMCAKCVAENKVMNADKKTCTRCAAKKG